ncbi:MAG TPA: hypothetical protein VKT25_15375 [Ktedonobacteraceae bacterium]|nr:hypothetical protein [Ktedonobacteraceae bacterium]
MKRIRYYLAAFALVATLSGPVLVGANVSAFARAGSRLGVGQSVRTLAVKRYGPCPILGQDC